MEIAMSEAEATAGKAETPAKDKKAARISPAAGVGVGVAIGSAAIVAALLYANRSKKADKKG
jgi:hypothetical protein